MRKKKLLFLLLALIMSATGAHAQTVGTRFKVGDITYQISAKDLNNPANNTVSIYEIGGSGIVNVPGSVTNEQDHESYKVTSVIPWIPNQIKTGVTEIVFPETLTSIPRGSFKQCDNPTFTKVTIPASCTSIGPEVFIVNPSFKEFVVKSGNPNYKAVNGILCTADGKTLHMCPPGKEGDLFIPEGVTKVEVWGIGQCTKLGKIYIPSTLTEFYGPSFVCSGREYEVSKNNPRLSTIDGGVLCNKNRDAIISYPHHHRGNASPHPYTIPSSIKTIGRMAFYASNVSELHLNKVETVSSTAFQYSYALTTINIGPNVKDIGESAFSGCTNLTHINVDPNNPSYKAVDDVLFNKAGDHLMLCATKKSGDYTVPAGVKHIDDHAFLGTTDLTTITVSKDVEEIGNNAFSGSAIKAINIESGSKLKTIKSEAFAQANSLTKITIPASVTTIQPKAFTSMDALKTVTFEGGSRLEEITKNSFSNNKNLENVVFAGNSSLKTIQPEAFAHDPKLRSFEMPASVTSIEQGAFLDTPSLTTVTFKAPSSISTIGQGAFAYSGITNITLPESVTKIEQQAFDNCQKLKTINIPKNVSNIETGAFNFCESLTAINVDKGNPSYSSLDGMLCSKDKKTLVTFPAGKADTKYTLIPYFTTVGQYAFYSSDKVTNITFPKSVTGIKTRALALCKNLKSLSFMGTDNVPTLDADILYQSTNPKAVTIFVRKKWYESNRSVVDNYNNMFKEVHPSFVSAAGYDRGTEFFPTSTDNVGVISFYTPRTSVIIDKKAKESANTDVYGKAWPEKTYTVSSVLDFAYQNDTKVKDIVMLADIGSIGLDAFRAGTQLKGLYFVGNTPATLNSIGYEMPDDYPFNDNQSIYVKETKVDDYKKVWGQGHTLNITYKIPQTTSRNGGSVCFPFDVVYPQNLGDNDIKPYVPMEYTHAYDTGNPFVKAYSIDNYYVPAFVGALIRSKETASVNSYCRMDETQAHDKSALTNLGYNETGNNCMMGAVEDTLIQNVNGYQYYAFSKSQGKFVKLEAGVNFPYFKAYLRMAGQTPSHTMGFMIVFNDGSTVTGIDGPTGATEREDTPYYNLDGMRVNKPTRGIYIHNGKKVIIK